MDPGPLGYVVAVVLAASLVSYAIWAWRIGRAIKPKGRDTPGHETERFHFKYGGDPPGADGGTPG